MLLKIFKTFYVYNLTPNILMNEILFDRVNIFVPEVINTFCKMFPILLCYIAM